MQYSKPPLTVEQQVALFQSRGMTVSDEAVAKSILQRISYYRLSAYALPWRQQGTDAYGTGLTFEGMLELYEFDRVLRNLIWEAVEPIEVMIRTKVTYHLATTYGTFAHLDPKKFIPTRPKHWDHKLWSVEIEEEATRSHEVFIAHYRKKYAGFPQLPLWMATEIMSFGSLSKLFDAMFTRDQRVVARGLGLHESYLPSWLHTISVIRNTCAHHGRLWDRGLGVKPILPQGMEWQPPSLIHKDRLGCILLMLNHLMHAGTVPCQNAWRQRVEDHLLPMITTNPRWSGNMGIPLNWPIHPLWRTNCAKGHALNTDAVRAVCARIRLRIGALRKKLALSDSSNARLRRNIENQIVATESDLRKAMDRR
jgi:abortive infection bacteriophage resistance protein